MDDVDSIEEPTSSLVWVDFILADFKGLYLVICKTLALIFPIQLKECSELHLCKNPTWNMHVYLAKLSILRPLWLTQLTWSMFPGCIYRDSTSQQWILFTMDQWLCLVQTENQLPRNIVIKFLIQYIEGILPKGPYMPCVSMAGGALLAGYPRYIWYIRMISWRGNIFCIALALYAGNPLVTSGFSLQGAIGVFFAVGLNML